MKGGKWNKKIGNKGMSLVELIIVVAIMALFIGSVTYSISWASGKAAEECAKKLAYSLQQARTMAMGKNSAIVTVKTDSSGNIVTVTKIISNTDSGESTNEIISTVGKKSVFVGFSDGTASKNLNEGDEVVFEFDRASGALKKLDNAEANTKSPVFTISKGNTKRTIEIVPITGRISVGK